MAPDSRLHLPLRDPDGEAGRRRIYTATLSFGLVLMGVSVLWQRLTGASDLYLIYGAPTLWLLGVFNLWWLLTKRSLVVSERLGIGVLAAANLARITLLCFESPVSGSINNGPYWGMVGVCTLVFLAFVPRQFFMFNLAYAALSLVLPWLLPGSAALHNVFEWLRVQLNAVVVLSLIWGLAWFRTQHAAQAVTQEQLRQMAFTDPLTQLPNRRAVYPAVDALLSAAARGQTGSLLLIDLDHFKRVNDECGHGVGDEVLVAAARVLQNAVTEVGAAPPTVGRWGGEEFIVVMPGAAAERARFRAEQLLADFRAHAWPHHLRLTISIGISTVRPSEDFSTLLARADESMYAAKSAGRDRVGVERVKMDDAEAEYGPAH
ncbi:GGDEF domain-containing protein [Deinococcus detaillensis]|uniref:GGDEF domain-containing protein n=1 Tax=Deinococcus detaillensis TaxID=2592048 RepID=A0A553UZJ8_9DEIO|nr:GGDEF domain-containing protein [Deinococcus detaillensis]TSA85632.1 GGDEF domain-containing protein [Deinococcus detaillensis]